MSGLLGKAWEWLALPQVPVVDGQLVGRQRRGRQSNARDSVLPEMHRSMADGAQDIQRPHSPSPVEPVIKPEPVAQPVTEPASEVEPVAAPRAEFCHPQASHQLQLAGHRVAYLLERSRRRSIGMTVCCLGLRVRAPLHLSLGAVERVLQDKAAWIVRKLVDQQRVQRSAPIAWGEQTQLPYLGHLLSVQLQWNGPGVRRSKPQWHAAQRMLQLPVPANATQNQLRRVVHAWWLTAARSHFIDRLNHFAPLLGVQWRSLGLSSARTRWGSARSDGSIRLNWRLLHYAPEIIDYVVVHELSHLQHMDHSPRFWATVASVLPDYRRLRQLLREQPAPRWGEEES